jgi:pimeloyl-ACP methyl ester carboxylesterase
MLVHGFSVPFYIWDSTAVALAGAGFRVARYDICGRGYSDRPDADYSVDLTDRQLVQLLDSLGWHEPIDLVGLSMGGVVTAAFTGRHPERVRSLTLVDPAAGPAGQIPAMFRLPIVGGLVWQTLVVPGMADNQLSDFVAPSGWPDWPDRYRSQMRFRGFGRALRSTAMEHATLDLDTLYARVGARGTRALLIWGKEDSTVSIAKAPGVVAAIPQIRFETIERAGHLPHMERTDVVNPLLIGFLRGGASPERAEDGQGSDAQ